MPDRAEPDALPCATFLFTDIEGSTRLWEQDTERMRVALARHDALSRQAIAAHGGRLVKGTGDGVHAMFDATAPGLAAVLQLQLAMHEPPADGGLALAVRAGLHRGPYEARDGDCYGPALNRAARVMSAAHGGQILLSQAVAAAAGALPAGSSLLDLGRVRLRDLASPEHVFQLCHPGLRAHFPPLRSLEATPNNLAQQLDSFVGREHDLAAARDALARTRLLTLFGMGGIGKSRLSVQLAAEMLDEFPDGVWLVELAPLADPLHVPQALASVLGVKEDSGRTLMEALLAHVRERRLLVLLDNCEHLVDACAGLARALLRAGAGVKVLATSRDALQLAGETVFPLQPLAVPAPGAGDDAATLLQHDAVRLFVDRAAAAQGSFRLDAGNAAAVAEICQRLDGIPLALELAAARTRGLPVQAVAARLADRFRLLSRGDRTLLPRQRTLRALIDWSHDLLDEPERRLFRRLAVFAGGWTLDAAEAVCAGDGLDVGDVPDLLSQLVGKSLVVIEPDGERYRMLETVRAYADERLLEAGDAASTRARHAEHFVALAERARAELAGPDQAAWLKRLDVERENLLAVHALGGRSDDSGERDLRLVYALRPYWLSRGLLELGHRVSVEALGRAGAQRRGLGRFRGLCDAGWLAVFLGRYAAARRDLDEALSIAREADRTDWAARALQPLGMACMGLGDVGAARAHLAEAVALARAGGNPRELAAALNGLAQLHRAQGEPALAEPLYAQALDHARTLGDQEYIAAFLLNLAMVAAERGDADGARSRLREGMGIALALGSQPATQSTLEVSAGLAADGGDADAAARFFGMAEALAAQTGLQRDAADAAFLRPRLAAARAALGDAAFAAAEAAGRALDARAALEQARRWLGG